MKLLIHNEVERYNKRPGVFISMFINMIQEKGHTYSIMKKTEPYKKERKEEEHKFLKEELVKADDIDKEQYQKMLSKQKNNCASRKDKICIEKYLYKKHFNVNEIDKEFIDNFYDKIDHIKRLKSLMFDEETPYYKSHTGKHLCVDYYKSQEQQRIIRLRDMINILGFSFTDKKKVISNELIEKIKLVHEKSLIYKDINFTSKLFEYPYKKIKNIDNVRKFVGMFNTLFKPYCIYMKSNRKSIRIKINGKIKVGHDTYYTLEYWNNIDKYVTIPPKTYNEYYIKHNSDIPTNYPVHKIQNKTYINQKDYAILESHDKVSFTCKNNDIDVDSDNEIYNMGEFDYQLNYKFIDSDDDNAPMYMLDF